LRVNIKYEPSEGYHAIDVRYNSQIRNSFGSQNQIKIERIRYKLTNIVSIIDKNG
jgi:hypothetical protein